MLICMADKEKVQVTLRWTLRIEGGLQIALDLVQ